MPDLKYRYARKIATGGMAEVSLAVQHGLGGFGKLVVIKRILPHLRDDPRFLKMFLAEAKLAALLNHPNIVKIYDVHRDDESFFIVMDYLSGEDLRFILGKISGRSINVPIPIACRILADISGALNYAHKMKDPKGEPLGIVHRDIAPGNIFVSYGGNTSLLDFGVAKANSHSIYTQPGMIKGKLGYSSPEQVNSIELDGRSDLFSLGIVAYELLTSKRLFRRDHESAVIKAILEEEIIPPSRLNPEIPTELDRLILHTLERDREKRIDDAGYFHRKIEAIGGGVGRLTHSRVSQWMHQNFGDRMEQRLALEKSLLNEADLFDEGDSLNPLFDDESSVRFPKTWDQAHHHSVLSKDNDQKGRKRRTVIITALIAVFLTLLALSFLWLAYYLGRVGAEKNDAKILSSHHIIEDGGQKKKGSRDAALENGSSITQTKNGLQNNKTEGKRVEPKNNRKRILNQDSKQLRPIRLQKKTTRLRKENAKRTNNQRLVSKHKDSNLPKKKTPLAVNKKIKVETKNEKGKLKSNLKNSISKIEKDKLPSKKEIERPFKNVQKENREEDRQRGIEAKKRAQEQDARRAVERAAARRAEEEERKKEKNRNRIAKKEEPKTGLIYIVSDSPGYVFVDGQNIGRMTPIRLRLSVGEHNIVVQLKVTKTRYEKRILIKSGKLIRLRLTE